MVAREADEAEEFAHPGRPGGGVADAVDQHRLGQDLLDRHARVEARERVLEDHLHLPAQGPQRRPSVAGDVAALDADRAAARLDQPQREPRQGGLAAAALAHHRQRLAGGDAQRHAVDRPDSADLPAQDQAPMHRVVLVHVVEFEERRHPFASTGAFQQATAWPGARSASGG